MGKVVPFARRPAPPTRTGPVRAAHLAPLLEPIFSLTFDGKGEDEQRQILEAVGRDYGALIRRYFGDADAKHFVRVFCGGVREGGERP